MIVTEETKALARRIADYFIASPKMHDQSHFVGSQNPADLGDDNVCGTTLCIAGAAIWLTQGKQGIIDHMVSGDWVETAAPLLGLEIGEFGDGEADDLFFEIQDEADAFNAVMAIAQGDQEKFDTIRGSAT